MIIEQTNSNLNNSELGYPIEIRHEKFNVSPVNSILKKNPNNSTFSSNGPSRKSYEQISEEIENQFTNSSFKTKLVNVLVQVLFVVLFDFKILKFYHKRK